MQTAWSLWPRKTRLQQDVKRSAQMMIRYNTLTPKEERDARGGDTSAYNTDRKVIDKLFDTLSAHALLRAMVGIRAS